MSQELFQNAFQLQREGKVNEAIKIYLTLLKDNEENPNLLLLIGTGYLQIKNHNSAEIFLKKSIIKDKNNCLAHNNLALVYQALGTYEKAISLLKISLKIMPNNSDTYSKFGNLYVEMKDYKKAIEEYKKAINFNPKNHLYYNNLGNALAEIKEYKNALTSYRKAIKIEKNFLEAYINMGDVLRIIGEYSEAILAYNNALKINPKSTKAYVGMGLAYSKIRNFKEAITNFSTAYNIEPDYEYLLGYLLDSKMFVCDWKDFDILLSKLIIGIKKKKKVIIPFSLLSIIDEPNLQKNASEIYLSSRAIEIKKKLLNKYNSNEKIKIGYYSADFFNHATLHLMKDVFKNHDKSKFEIYAFSFSPKDDFETSKIKSNFTKFFNVEKYSDKEIVDLSQSLKIDIAIDLKGLTEKNRIGIFLNRAAPIQINFLGYPGTMGTSAINYIIADKTTIPTKEKKYFLEKVIYLPNCYQPNTEAKVQFKKKFKRSDFGLDENKFIFCNFNHNYKITPMMFNLWINILKNSANSLLWLMAYNETAKNNLIKEAKKNRIDEKRIIFANPVSVNSHLNRIQLADIFLDTFPYNAHTIASDAIRMGVPIITKKGKSFASRVAASILNEVKLNELIVSSDEDYKNLAISLAKNKNQYKKIKSNLSKSILNSSLFDNKKFTKSLEDIYISLIK